MANAFSTKYRYFSKLIGSSSERKILTKRSRRIVGQGTPFTSAAARRTSGTIVCDTPITTAKLISPRILIDRKTGGRRSLFVIRLSIKVSFATWIIDTTINNEREKNRCFTSSRGCQQRCNVELLSVTTLRSFFTGEAVHFGKKTRIDSKENFEAT